MLPETSRLKIVFLLFFHPAFTNFPSIEYLYNTNEGHKLIGEYLQSVVSGVGVTMNLTNQEWNTFLNTRKNGDYTVARTGWLADCNDPISFLDMWVSGSGNNDSQFGKGEHGELKMFSIDLTPYSVDLKVENGTWTETYDAAIAAIKTCTDKTARYGMMHAPEDLAHEHRRHHPPVLLHGYLYAVQGRAWVLRQSSGLQVFHVLHRG